ncbi:hypothetical protein SAMN05660462_01085 [Proteiniborus ethanoligenes]|uniref:Uncharacterized protein n=1 Tax=Proteiniborus ethanoligenes TaxID=415015 RepID=A0A1H3NBW2_9FIRM|nr:hypothetical protein [Proteiniborus ethanoligenes]SDY85965.1 hypothetical protein SAMN05660462_01085 [Proteiniborus ethanoligenes]
MKNMKSILDKIESIILGLCVLGVFIFIVQLGFMESTDITTFINTYEEDEGSSMNIKEAGYVVVKKETNDFEKLKIIINGKDKYKFSKNNEVQLKVYDGDIIEVDSSMYDKEVEIKIVGISKNVQFPKLEEKIITKNSIDLISWVKIKP